MSLMSKFLTVLMAVSLVPVLALAYLAYRNSRAAMEFSSISHLTAVNQMKKTAIETWIDENRNTLEILANNPYFKTHFTHMMDHHSCGGSIHARQHACICTGYFNPVLQNKIFTELFVIRVPDGLVLVASDPSQLGKYFENRPFFIEGMKGTFIQNIHYSLTLQQSTMVVSTPLKDQQEKPAAVLAGRVNLDRLCTIMEKTTGLIRSEDTYLVNSFNYFVTEPRFKKGYALRKSTYTLGVTRALSGQSGTAFYPNYRGVPVIGVYTWLPERQLALITEMDQHEAFEPIRALQASMASVCLAVMAAVIGISWLASRSLTRPLERLSRSIQRMGQGHLDIPVEQTTKDEIGKLARAFARMAFDLKTIMVSKESLEQEIVERKKTEQKLNAVRTDLERSNRDLEQFAHVASHDLKEPLRMVKSYLELLRETLSPPLDEPLETCIRFAMDGAVRMEQMIGDLLSFSKVGSHGVDLPWVSAEEALETAKMNLQIAILESSARITSDPMPKVYADSIQLVQIFQNLLANAITFSEGPPRIHVSAVTQENLCRFSVKDNGIGIDPRHRDRIFNIFHRLHSRDKYPGTGIGLALCRRIVERHGGHIWFESKPGEGTEFFFTLRICAKGFEGQGGPK